MRNIRKVKWLPGEKTEKLITHPFMHERAIDEYFNSESLKAAMYPGALWFSNWQLAEDKRFVSVGCTPHEFPYIAYTELDNPQFPPGTPAVYMCQVRVEEQYMSTSTTTRVLRHSFIIGGKRFITYDIGKLFYPA